MTEELSRDHHFRHRTDTKIARYWQHKLTPPAMNKKSLVNISHLLYWHSRFLNSVLTVKMAPDPPRETNLEVLHKSIGCLMMYPCIDPCDKRIHRLHLKDHQPTEPQRVQPEAHRWGSHGTPRKKPLLQKKRTPSLLLEAHASQKLRVINCM